MEQRCLYCNKLFIPNPTAKVKAKYCSNYCRCKSWEKCNPEKYKQQSLNLRKKILSNPILHEKSKAQQRKHSHSIKGRYTQIKFQAKIRNYEFNLTRKQFFKFWGKSCYYCGGTINGIGIDRVNNTQGYNIKNCVPCCQICNVMKNCMTVEQFIYKCKQIIANSN